METGPDILWEESHTAWIHFFSLYERIGKSTGLNTLEAMDMDLDKDPIYTEPRKY